jgi:hypothetical protein
MHTDGHTQATEPAELIERYFHRAALSDTDGYFAQFHPDATVEDEGQHHHGVDAIRAWRSEVPMVSYEVRDMQRDDRKHIARAVIAGDFPGSPVELALHFTFTHGGLIQTLAIRA